MDTPFLKLEVNARVCSQVPSTLGFLNRVLITQNKITEEFMIDESDGSSLGSFPSSSSLPHPPICFELPDFTFDRVYEHVFGRFHDQVLSNLISREIVFEALREDLPRRPFFMNVSVNLTHKSFSVLPSSTSRSFQSDSCPICLDHLSEKTKHICQLPLCGHLFHETCIVECLNRGNSICPLCRQDVNKNQSGFNSSVFSSLWP